MNQILGYLFLFSHIRRFPFIGQFPLVSHDYIFCFVFLLCFVFLFYFPWSVGRVVGSVGGAHAAAALCAPGAAVMPTRHGGAGRPRGAQVAQRPQNHLTRRVCVPKQSMLIVSIDALVSPICKCPSNLRFTLPEGYEHLEGS